MSIPTEMKPTNVPRGNLTADPYFCGNPGGATSITSEPGCSWDIKPPSVHYNWVKAGGPSCSSTIACTGDHICGLSDNVGHAQRIQMTCGQQLGYWTGDQICGIDRNYGAPFNCAQNINLYGCIGPNAQSCYQPGANPNTCCGCANWWEEGIPVPTSTQKCVAQDPVWKQNIMPGLKWMK